MTMKYLPLLDFDAAFYADPDSREIPIGIKTYTASNRLKDFMNDIYRVDSGDMAFFASCECGSSSGNYAKGTICPHCKTEVVDAFAGDLKFEAWIKIPEYVPPFLHPVAYRVFRRWLGKYSRVPLLDLLLDSESELDDELLEKVGHGMDNFYKNFDKIVKFFLNEYKPLQKTPQKAACIPEFIAKYKHCLFVRHLPILNQNLHVMSSQGDMRYTDDASQWIFKAVVELSNLAHAYSTSSRSTEYVEQNALEVYNAYLKYVSSIVYTKLTGKAKFIRKYLMGTRCHFTFRGVIVPITCVHEGDELHLPWRILLSGLKCEILNLLQNRYGQSLAAAFESWHKAQFKYDEIIHEVIETLISECVKSTKQWKHPLPGLPIYFGRNPSMQHGSAQLLFATKVKTDLEDDTIGLSPLILGPFNADFDGDAMFGLFIKELNLVPKFMSTHPMTTMLCGDTLSLTESIKLTDQAKIAVHSWLTDPDQHVTA